MEKQAVEAQAQEARLKEHIMRVDRHHEHHDLIVAKMNECRHELRQAMLNNLMCLDFYRDLENYVGERRYSAQEPGVLDTIADLDRLLSQHGLHSIDFDTERMQHLTESIEDYLKTNAQQEKRILRIDLSQPEPTEQIKIKVTKLASPQPEL